MTEDNKNESQRDVCKRLGVEFYPTDEDFRIGVSASVKEGVVPINGLRHSPEAGTSGWFIWSGDYSEDDDFFQPIHVRHIDEWSPLISKYLGLPPGYRFQIDDKGYEDVWFDESLAK